jgi:hypothetical protein
MTSSVSKKWCVLSLLVRVANKVREVEKSIFAIPVIRLSTLLQNTMFIDEKPLITTNLR